MVWKQIKECRRLPENPKEYTLKAAKHGTIMAVTFKRSKYFWYIIDTSTGQVYVGRTKESSIFATRWVGSTEALMLSIFEGSPAPTLA